MPQATGLVAELKAAFPDKKVEAELVKGDNGAFEIGYEGKTVFSKHKLSRFPAYQEIPVLLTDLGA